MAIDSVSIMNLALPKLVLAWHAWALRCLSPLLLIVGHSSSLVFKYLCPRKLVLVCYLSWQVHWVLWSLSWLVLYFDIEYFIILELLFFEVLLDQPIHLELVWKWALDCFLTAALRCGFVARNFKGSLGDKGWLLLLKLVFEIWVTIVLVWVTVICHFTIKVFENITLLFSIDFNHLLIECIYSGRWYCRSLSTSRSSLSPFTSYFLSI